MDRPAFFRIPFVVALVVAISDSSIKNAIPQMIMAGVLCTAPFAICERFYASFASLRISHVENGSSMMFSPRSGSNSTLDF